MKNTLLTFLLSLTFTISFSQNIDEKYGKPMVILIETDPWLMVVGSDVPTFALYENGQIIYKKIVNKQWEYFEITNDKEATQKIIKSFGITDRLMNQQQHIDASGSTDQPTNIIILNFDSVKQLSVYGELRNSKSEARKRVPKDFLTVYDNIIKFQDDDAGKWLPGTFEVLATSYSHSPEVPLKWNQDWNNIQSSSTVKRSEDLYSIYLNIKYYDDFKKLLSALKQKQGVEINGKKYSLSYRLPFPNLY